MNVNAPIPPSTRAGASVIVYGPQGSGKSFHAEALRAFFGCTAVEEDTADIYRQISSPGAAAEFKARNVLVLTHIAPPESLIDNRRILHIRDALRVAGLVSSTKARAA